MWIRRLHCAVLLSILAPMAYAARNGPAMLPLIFERNACQASTSVSFLARRPGMNVFFAESGPAFAFARKTIRMEFLDSDPRAIVKGENKTTGSSNYLIGNDPSRWTLGVEQFAR